MNKFGSGITHFDEYKSDEMTLFNGGLRSDRKSILKNQKGDHKNEHDKMSYSRGTIMHSRSPANQYLNFHWYYGGSKKFFIQRYLHQVLYKRILRQTAIPVVVIVSR